MHRGRRWPLLLPLLLLPLLVVVPVVLLVLLLLLLLMLALLALLLRQLLLLLLLLRGTRTTVDDQSLIFIQVRRSVGNLTRRSTNSHCRAFGNSARGKGAAVIIAAATSIATSRCSLSPVQPGAEHVLHGRVRPTCRSDPVPSVRGGHRPLLLHRIAAGALVGGPWSHADNHLANSKEFIVSKPSRHASQGIGLDRRDGQPFRQEHGQDP